MDELSDGTNLTLMNYLPKKKSEIKKNSNKKYEICKGYVSIAFGTLLTALGITTIINPLFDFFMSERLEMNPGFPSFELWAKSDPTIFCRVYFFNVTNSENFLNGIDSKIKLKEIGPIVYKEHQIHSNIVRNIENSTMTYDIRRYIEFVPELNEVGILNKTIIVPNIPLLTMAAIIQNQHFGLRLLTRPGFNLLSKKDKVFLNPTIYEYLWDLTTPALDKASELDRLKLMVPLDNSGTLLNVYKNYNNSANVKIGSKYGDHDFFKIQNFDYRPYVPGYYPEYGDCAESLVNSSEGSIYGGFLDKNEVLYYWRKTVCKAVPLHFEREMQMGSYFAYKYIVKPNLFDRTNDSTTDCSKRFYGTDYPDGLADASKCFSGLPITMSLPHFYGRTHRLWSEKIEGFNPSKDKHTSFAIVEPITGTPLEQIARAQSNLALPKLNGMNKDVLKFSDMVLPLIWMEYHLPDLPPLVHLMIYFAANILPTAQFVIPPIFLLIGIYLIYSGINKILLRIKYCKKWKRKVFLKISEEK